MAVERRGFSTAIWNTSYDQFFGPPSESFRFIDPFTHHVDTSTLPKQISKDLIPLVDCAVSHAARCILSTANACDMGTVPNFTLF